MADVATLMNVLLGKKKTDEVQLMELIIDDEILEKYTTMYLRRTWVSYDRLDFIKRGQYWDNVILCYKELGYSGLRVSNGLMFTFASIKGKDKSSTSTKERKWSDHRGKIRDEETFQNYPWPTIDDLALFDYKYVSEHLPEGMGIFACVYGGIFEMLCEYLVGFEELCYMEMDNPDLLMAIFSKVGDLLLEAYKEIVKVPRVSCIFQGDDFGYTQGLLFPPNFYDKYVIPWHKRLADIAHGAGIPYILHSCGNLRSLDSLFEIGFDAKHSFEDKGWSVIDFYNEHGKQVGVIGGVDVDKLCRLGKEELVKYCTSILENCHPNGRYAYGSGNSIANYVPLENFLIMLDVAKKFRSKNYE